MTTTVDNSTNQENDFPMKNERIERTRRLTESELEVLKRVAGDSTNQQPRIITMKRAIIHCPDCNVEFPGRSGGKNFVNHICGAPICQGCKAEGVTRTATTQRNGFDVCDQCADWFDRTE